MDIPEALIELIHESPVLGARELCEHVIEVNSGVSGWEDDLIDLFLQAMAIIEVLASDGRIVVGIGLPALLGPPEVVGGKAIEYFRGVSELLGRQAMALKLDAHRVTFANALGRAGGYEFTDGDIEQIQAAINDLRKMLAKAQELEPQHRDRMLKRLEAFQRELHKKMADVTKFFGFMGDVGVLIKKLGNDAKPMVDRYEQIMKAGWQAEARSAGLPHDSEMPLVGNDQTNQLD